MFSFYTTEGDLKCLQCHESFNEAKVLECGFTICKNCDSRLMMDKCRLCDKPHKSDDMGLAIKKSKNINISPLFLNITQKLDKIKVDIEDIEDKMENMESKIKTHCENLRFEIEIHFESLLDNVHKNREDLLNQVNKFEIKKLNEIRNFSKNDEFNELKTSISQYKSDYNRIKSSNILGSDNIDKILNEVNELNMKLIEKKLVIENNLNSNMLYLDEPNVMLNNEIASLSLSNKIPNSDLFVEKLRLVGRNKISYSTKYQIVRKTHTAINNNGDIAILIEFIDKKKELRIYKNKIGRRDALIKTLDNSYANKRVILSERFAFIQFFKSLIYNSTYYMQSFDLNNLETNKQIELKLNSVNICDNKLVFTDERQLHVYNENMEKIVSFGQSNSVFKPYYINSDNVWLKNGYIFALSNSLRILDEETGLLVKEFKLKNVIQILGPNSLILTAANENKVFKIYDWNMNLSSEFSIQDVSEISQVKVTENGNILLNDENNLTLYFN